MGPRSTLTARTLRGVWGRYEYRTASNTRAASVGQIHRGRGGVFELFVNANQSFFQGAAGVKSNLPSRRQRQIHRGLPSTVSVWMRAAWLRVQNRGGSRQTLQ